MQYKHFYRAIITRILFIVLFSALAAWSWFQMETYTLFIIGVLGIVIITINTIRYFNNINRWIAFFLLGIENEDTTLKIPRKTGSKAVDDVFKGMDRLNDLFKQTKIEISTQEQYFRLVINQSATGLFSVNENGRIINLNPTAEKLTKLRQYHHINALKKIDASLPQFIVQDAKQRNQDSVIFENQYGQKLLFKLSELITSKEKMKLVAVSDITKELDNGEVDAWIKLARTLSHEIMNNIAPITTLSQVISGYFSKDNEIIDASQLEQKTIANIVKGLEVIEERSVGLMNFVDNYRKFTKLPEPKFIEVNLSDLIEKNILAASGFEGFEQIEFEKNILRDALAVTDEKLLSQVITNLLKNGVESLVHDKTENPRIVVKLKQNDNLFRIEIINNGPLIPQEIKEQIFVPFFTTKDEGSGIGLSLSKQIMLIMGGDIHLKTIDNMLTAFIVTIPMV
jgi:two-component system nitrogen regulation sensor histidine kinase NtrY